MLRHQLEPSYGPVKQQQAIIMSAERNATVTAAPAAVVGAAAGAQPLPCMHYLPGSYRACSWATSHSQKSELPGALQAMYTDTGSQNATHILIGVGPGSLWLAQAWHSVCRSS